MDTARIPTSVMKPAGRVGETAAPRGATPMHKFSGPAGCSAMNLPVKRVMTPAERMAKARAARGGNSNA
jgi:hypothetical protein